MLRQCKRIARPATVIKWHRIGMPRQQQAASPLSVTGQHIKFVASSWNRLHFHIEAQIFKPVRQQSD
ncbi:Uncharacterised protein [Shigella flexneri]|nr:Uncharacterised protein [Shigella flexneri]